MRQRFRNRMNWSERRAETAAPRPKVIPFSPRTSTPQPQSATLGRPGLLRRIGAETVNRLIPLLIVGPLFALPLWLAGGRSYLLSAYLLWLCVWHLCCDGAPNRPSFGKRLFYLRLMSVTEKSSCTLRQRMLRRLGSAVSQTLYSLVIVLNFPASAAQTQAETLARWLLAPIHWFGYELRTTALLMFLALALDALGLLFVALNAQARSLGDWLTDTRVVTKEAYESYQRVKQQ